jgi:hypothetical protein
MAVGKSVQFRGISNAVKAYENMDVPQWGLFQGTQFLMKYDGSDVEQGAAVLTDYLNALDLRSNDSNTYTLCIYDSPGLKINSGTKYDASFNFRLVDNIEDHAMGRVGAAYSDRLAGIEETLKALTAEPEVEEVTPKDQMWSALGKILEHPQVQNAIATKVLTIVDSLGDTITGLFPRKAAYQPAAIGAAPKANAVQDENAKLQEAVNYLATIDKQLGTHLLQLATIAKGDPKKYELMITMLNSM